MAPNWGWTEEEAARNRGMSAAEKAAGEAWGRLARTEILRYGTTHDTFSANDVRPLLPVPRQKKALGSHFNALARAGLLEQVQVGYNDIKGGHRAKLWVWRITPEGRAHYAKLCAEQMLGGS